VGVMGGGLARAFADRFGKDYVEAYEEDCKKRRLMPGKCSFYVTEHGLVICNFPTKNHYRDDSRYEWIASGMANLAGRISAANAEVTLKTNTVGIPALGCGLGNLNWEKVKHIIRMGAQLAPEVEWTIYLQ